MARSRPTGAKKGNFYGAFVALADALVKCYHDGGLTDPLKEKAFFRALEEDLQRAKGDPIGPAGEYPNWFLRRIPRLSHFESVDVREGVRQRFRFLKEPLKGRPGDLGRLDRYRVLRGLGEGSMGVVFEAIPEGDDLSGNSVAIKAIRPEEYDSDTRSRFEKEASIMHSLCKRHSNTSNIVRIREYHAAAKSAPYPYLVMDYVCGPSLLDLYRAFPDGVFPLDLAIDIALQIARGLRTVHPIAHRDLKPGNVLLRRVQGVPTVTGWDVLVGDFGLARAGGRTKTASTSFSGNELYCAPEQCNGKHSVNWRCDLFALGLILHEMLTGWHPRTRSKAGTKEYDPFFDWKPKPALESLPSDLADLIARLLQEKPGARGTAEDAISDLEAAQTQKRTTGRGTSQGTTAGASKGNRQDSVPPPGRNEVVADIARALAGLGPAPAGHVRAAVRLLVAKSAPENAKNCDSNQDLATAIVDISPCVLIPAFTDLLMNALRNDANSKRVLRYIVNRYVPWTRTRPVPELAGTAPPVLDSASSAAIAELMAARELDKPSWFRMAKNMWQMTGILAVEWEWPPIDVSSPEAPEDPVLRAAIAVMEDILSTTESSLADRRAIQRDTSERNREMSMSLSGQSEAEITFDATAKRLTASLVRTSVLSVQRPSYCVLRFLPDQNEREFAIAVLSKIRAVASTLKFFEILPTAPQEDLDLMNHLHEFYSWSETEPLNA